jgi:hypothetical protein
VDPTGAIPLPIKGMERTDERPAHRSSVARGAEEVRHKRTVRTIVLAVVALSVVVVGAAWAVINLGHKEATPPPTVATPAPVAQPPAAPPAPPPPAAVAEPGKPEPAGEPAKAEPVKAPPAPEPAKAAAKAPPPPAARAATPPAPKAAPAVAKAEPPPPPPAKPAAPPKKKDSVLDFDQGAEDDLTAALGGTGGRSVYVPPKPGGTSAPDRLTDAQITESVKLHVDALRRCAAEQQAREPGAKGTLKMAWTIQQDGAPKDVRCLTPDLATSPFAQCITGVVKGIRFPRLADAKGQLVTFPFGF